MAFENLRSTDCDDAAGKSDFRLRNNKVMLDSESKSFATILLLFGIFLIPRMALSATVSVGSQDLNPNQPAHDGCVLTSSGPFLQCVSGPNAATAGGIGFGSASADIVSGELKVFAEAIGNSSAELNFVSAAANASFSETYSVTGTGIVTALMQLDGSWNLGSFGSTAINFSAQLNIDDGSGSGAEFAINANIAPATGSVDQLFSVDFDVQDGANLLIQYSLFTIIGSGFGVMDFSNTGRAQVVAGTGVTITPIDPLFLSNPTFNDGTIPAVPVPAAVWLFGTALIGLIGFDRQRNNA